MVANILTRIKNSYNSKALYLVVPNSKYTLKFIQVLYKEGFLRGYEVVQGEGIKLLLKYKNNKPSIQSFTILNKSSKHTYVTVSDLVHYNTGLSLYILSTPKGIMSHHSALREKVGGVVLCKIE